MLLDLLRLQSAPALLNNSTLINKSHVIPLHHYSHDLKQVDVAFWTGSLLISTVSELILREDSLLAHIVSHKDLKVMVDDLVVVGDGMHRVSDDCCLLLENSNCSHDFQPLVFLCVKIFERLGILILSLLVKNDLKSLSVVTHFEYCSHPLLFNLKQSTNDDYLEKKQQVNKN